MKHYEILVASPCRSKVYYASGLSIDEACVRVRRAFCKEYPDDDKRGLIIEDLAAIRWDKKGLK